MSDRDNSLTSLDETANTNDLVEVLTFEHEKIKARKNSVIKALDDLGKFYTNVWEEKDHKDQIYQYAMINQTDFNTPANIILGELHAVYPIYLNLLTVESKAIGTINGATRGQVLEPEREESLSIRDRLMGRKKEPIENRTINTLYGRSSDIVDETKQFPRTWARWLNYHTNGVISAESKILSKGELDMQRSYMFPEYSFFTSDAVYAINMIFGENHRLILEKEKENAVKVTTRAYEDRDRHSNQPFRNMEPQ